MAVEREAVEHPMWEGSMSPVKVRRQKNGEWTASIEIDVRIVIDDTRDIYIKKTVAVRATEQRGRKR